VVNSGKKAENRTPVGIAVWWILEKKAKTARQPVLWCGGFRKKCRKPHAGRHRGVVDSGEKAENRMLAGIAVWWILQNKLKTARGPASRCGGFCKTSRKPHASLYCGVVDPAKLAEKPSQRENRCFLMPPWHKSVDCDLFLHLRI
jgi:hypothetical protein